AVDSGVKRSAGAENSGRSERDSVRGGRTKRAILPEARARAQNDPSPTSDTRTPARPASAPRSGTFFSGRASALAETAGGGLAEGARARIRNAALYSPPRYGDEVEQLARDRAQAEPRADGGRDLGQPLAGIEVQAVRLVQQQEHPHLVEREYGQIGAGHEYRGCDDAVLARERRDDPVADRAA